MQLLYQQKMEQTGSASLWKHRCLRTFYLTSLGRKDTLLRIGDCFCFSWWLKRKFLEMNRNLSQITCCFWVPRSQVTLNVKKQNKKNYLTVGAVMIPMKRILPQLKGWLAWNTKICFKKNVFNSVSYVKIKKKKNQLVVFNKS